MWGPVRPFTLKKLDLVAPRYETRQLGVYVRLERKKLPRTIIDVMAVVKALKQRYLWVDCLCIVQDGLDEIKTAVHAMDRVFKAAALTLISADGGSAQSGFTGLYPGSRNVETLTGSVEGISAELVMD